MDLQALTYEEIEVEILENLKWLDKVIYSYILILLTVSLYSIFSIKTFDILGLKIEKKYFIALYLVFTFSHFYVTILLMKSIRNAWQLEKVERIKIFRKILSTSNILIRGLKRREILIISEKFEKKKYISSNIDMTEPPFWVALIIIILSFIACSNFTDNYLINVLIIFSITTISSFNWYIGSHWAVSIAELDTDVEKSTFFAELGNNLFFYNLSIHTNSFFEGSGLGGVYPKSILLLPLYFPFRLIIEILKVNIYIIGLILVAPLMLIDKIIKK